MVEEINLRKLYGVIGDPIAHSLSPEIHQTFYEQTGMDAEYQKIHIKQGMLPEGVQRLKERGFKGFNVTVPHKTDIIPLLDEVDEIAAKVKAVNTVKIEQEKLIGYNTDTFGFLQSLKEIEPEYKNKNIVIIGAGGAAKAIYHVLLNELVQKLDIANRTMEKAEEIVKSSANSGVQSTVLRLDKLEEDINRYDILIQTTSVGLSPNINETPISLTSWDGKVKTAIDIIYNPRETMFLRQARNKGAKIENGINMLLYQAAFAFEIWTGIMPTVDTARKKILEHLEGVK